MTDHGESRDRISLEACALALREARVGADVVHRDRLAASVRIEERRSHARHRPATAQSHHTAVEGVANDELVALDVRVHDAVRAQVLAQQPRSSRSHLNGIDQRPERVGELEEKCQALLAPADRRLGAGPFDGFPGALGDIADELDFSGGPVARRRVVRAERGDQPSALEQHHANEARQSACSRKTARADSENPRIGADVADHDGFATLKRIAEAPARRRRASPRPASGATPRTYSRRMVDL